MKKVIFLDVDGVLNIYSESYKTNSVDNDNKFPELITRMEYHLVKRLEFIIDMTDAEIVLISGWDLKSTKRVLKQNNFKHLDKLKEKLNSNDRILGILNYVKQNKIDKFIVLDDETDFERVLELVPKEFKNSWIEIDFSEGLTNKISLYVFKLLNDLI